MTDPEYPPLHALLREMDLTPGVFRDRLRAAGHEMDARTLRRYLAPIGAPSSRGAPEWLLVFAREMAGRSEAAEWIVGTDEIGRRVVVHAVAPRFAAVMQGRSTVAAIDWWDDDVSNGVNWEEAARRASERFYHRSYKAARHPFPISD